ncbi:NUDIX domain-containing protein [Pseudoruegeria sp. SK021]|uniref:NUDIX domain-containing protein n=1 Tax=Pseudoruegeria sp. SK021 TaxID=1933035 RepID=UPI000A2182FF|nr:NUDIX domain-containing protein [Pseudoruegeria sp. SK021]OSP55572.1 hypothetical protein BV911_06820 [Pseudoruegeria sp. SK021]
MSRYVIAEFPFDDEALVQGLASAPTSDATKDAQEPSPRYVAMAGPDQSWPLWQVSETVATRAGYLAAVFGLDPATVEVTRDGTAIPAIQFKVDPAAAKSVRRDGRWPAILREASTEILTYLGDRTPQQVAARLGMILSRADAKVLAQQTTHGGESGLDHSDIHMVTVRRPYSEYFALEEYVFSHTRFDGGESPVVERAAMIAADAVTVLPYDPVRDRVLLVEQVRVAPIARGDRQPWVLEAVAGRIEPGDTPEQTAHKEAQEEAGVTLSQLFSVADYYPSTGCFSEFVYSYIGLTDLPDGAAGLGGVAAEGEDIRGHILPRTVFMDRVRAGQIRNAPLLISAYWLEANLSRVRGAG